MAKHTKHKRSASHRDDDDDDEKLSPPPRRKRGRIAAGVILVLAMGGGAFVNWHRRKDPLRVWARGIEQQHARYVDDNLKRCFDGTDSNAVRRVEAELRAGRVPASFRRCRGATLSEFAVSPMVFANALRDPPQAVESTAQREQRKLEDLRVSLNALQRAISSLGDDLVSTPANRERISHALEELAVDVDEERTSFGDMIAAAESAASTL
jgi:hypothetical protein